MLEKTQTCGAFKPILVAKNGLIPVETTAAPIHIFCTFSSASPLSKGRRLAQSTLNVLGGDLIGITGVNMPNDIANNDILITFNNSEQTKCVPVSSNENNLICQTERFNKQDGLNQVYTLVIQINGLNMPNNLSFNTKSTNEPAISLSPTSVSPVLRSILTFTLRNDFPYTLSSVSDFAVEVISKHNSNYKKQVAVISVDDSTKKVVCKFQGALSGDYKA